MTIALFWASGCGLGVSEYDDAILDGVSHLNTGKPEEALADFNRAVKINPELADGYLGRANTLNTMGKYNKSLEDYDRAIAIKPDLANAYVNRGIAYSHLGKFQKAIADFKKGLELDPKIDNKPGFLKRLFSNEPNTEKGIRKHLEILEDLVKNQNAK